MEKIKLFHKNKIFEKITFSKVFKLIFFFKNKKNLSKEYLVNLRKNIIKYLKLYEYFQINQKKEF